MGLTRRGRKIHSGPMAVAGDPSVSAKAPARTAQKGSHAAEHEIASPAQLRAVLRLQSEATAERSQLSFAESITSYAVTAFWNALNTGLNVALPPGGQSTVPAQARSAAEQFGRTVSSFEVVEAAGHLGLLYTSLLPSELRSERGVYYTPPALAERLLDQAEAAGIDWATARVADPASGGGAFLIPTARRMLRALGKCSPAFAIQNISTRLRGFELDPFSAWMSQVFFEAELRSQISISGRRPGVFVIVGDSLRMNVDEAFDLVIGNPPFGRQKLNPEVRAKFARSLYGHANLYGIFTDLAVRMTRSGGLISFLTPSSFLAGEYFKNLRSTLWHEAPPITVDFVSARKGVFEDVLQETVLASYRKGGRRTKVDVAFIYPSPGQPVTVQAAGRFALPVEPTAPWLLARHADEAMLAKKLAMMPTRLSDWGYRVSTGPLVWNRHKNQLCKKAEAGAVPLVWAESVTRDGQFELRCKQRNHQPYFRLLPGDEWLIVKSPCVLLQRTTAKEQARRLIAAEMPASLLMRFGAVTVENHLNMLVPISNSPVVSPALLAAFLNSETADRAFRCLSGSVAVSAYELENLPLPSAQALKKLVGAKVSKAAVSKAVFTLYAKGGAK